MYNNLSLFIHIYKEIVCMHERENMMREEITTEGQKMNQRHKEIRIHKKCSLKLELADYLLLCLQIPEVPYRTLLILWRWPMESLTFSEEYFSLCPFLSLCKGNAKV